MEALPHRPAPARSPVERVRDWIEWFGLGRLVVIALSVAAVGAGGYWLLRPPPLPVESTLPMASPAGTAGPGAAVTSSTAGATTTVPAVDIVVHVAGAVVAPGVHHLAGGARVVDAITSAGGLAADAQPDAINLAAPLRDGDRIYVPRTSDPAVVVPAGVTPSGAASGPGADTGDAASAGPVDLNTATAEQLDTLPGVGPSTAAAIIAHRDAHGPFASVDGLADVRGIGPAKLEALRDLVTV